MNGLDAQQVVFRRLKAGPSDLKPDASRARQLVQQATGAETTDVWREQTDVYGDDWIPTSFGQS